MLLVNTHQDQARVLMAGVLRWYIAVCAEWEASVVEKDMGR